MKNQIDIIKMANAMQKERELDHEIPEVCMKKFESSFNDIFVNGKGFMHVSFDGGEIRAKPIRTDQVMLDNGHKWSDF